MARLVRVLFIRRVKAPFAHALAFQKVNVKCQIQVDEGAALVVQNVLSVKQRVVKRLDINDQAGKLHVQKRINQIHFTAARNE